MMDQPCSSTFQETDAGIVYRLAHACTLEPGEAVTVTFYWGVGFEEVAAATSAKEMLRQGWQHELQVTTDWLDARRWPIPDAQLSASTIPICSSACSTPPGSPWIPRSWFWSPAAARATM